MDTHDTRMAPARLGSWGITFSHRDVTGRRCFLLTHAKVMSTTLKAQATLLASPKTANRLHKALFACAYLARLNRLRLAPPLYLIARNPLARMESYFRHVFRRNEHDKHIRRACAPLFEACGLSARDALASRDYQLEHFKRLSLEQIVLALRDPAVRRSFLCDECSAPQTLFVNRPFYIFALPCDRVLKIESVADRAFMEQDLGLDLSLRENSSRTPDEDPRRLAYAWTRPMREVMYQTYRRDFDWLGYDPFAN